MLQYIKKMSLSLLFLSASDFSIRNSEKGDILCHDIPGFSLILFYSTQCGHCKNLIPIFKQLPGTIGGCQFGMINVSTNKQCIRLSNNTIAPITYVPYIVLYVNGTPFMRYNGSYEKTEIQRFIMEVANKLQNKQKFSENVVVGNKRSIPEYTIGQPKCEDNVCYLEFDNAYKK